MSDIEQLIADKLAQNETLFPDPPKTKVRSRRPLEELEPVMERHGVAMNNGNLISAVLGCLGLSFITISFIVTIVCILLK